MINDDLVCTIVFCLFYGEVFQILNKLDFRVILNKVLSFLRQSRLSDVYDDLVCAIVLCLLYAELFQILEKRNLGEMLSLSQAQLC